VSLEYLVGSIYAVSVNNQETVAVRDWNRRNSVFETELRLTFSPIFRNDAMALVGSQGTILSTMASISSENVAA
jgi:hypothetical protein